MKTLVVSGYGKGEKPTLVIAKQPFFEDNPSFCCSFEKRLVTLNELAGTGKVCLYEQREEGWLLVDTKKVEGGGMCHLSYSIKHQLLFGACYETGHIFSIEVLEDGFGAVTSFIRLEPREADQISRAHCVQMDPQEQYLYAVNIHTDTIWCFVVEDGKLMLNRACEKYVLPKGNGPRHIIFHHELPIAYVITEYSNIIFVMKHDRQTGRLEVIQEISLLPVDFAGESYGATCVISDDGRYLYGANRGHNSIIHFEVLEDGHLQTKQIVSCEGDWPRHVALSRDGEQLFICNQKSNDVAILQVLPETGELGKLIGKIDFQEPSFVEEIMIG